MLILLLLCSHKHMYEQHSLYNSNTILYIYIYIYISAVKFQILGCSRELQKLKKISSSRELQISHI